MATDRVALGGLQVDVLAVASRRISSATAVMGVVEEFLDSGLALVNEEPATTAWFAIRLTGSTYGIFDVFPDDSGRDAHLSGRVAEALMAQAPDLFDGSPKIEKVDVLATKLP